MAKTFVLQWSGIVLLTLISNSLNAQQDKPLPYESIPEYPENYTAGSVVSRMIDGLGFRYYWATEGLTGADLQYKPSESNRTIGETIDHIHNLARVIHNSAIKVENDPDKTGPIPEKLAEKRQLTLNYLKKASEIFKEATDLSDHEIVFVRDGSTARFPFWNQINGPIEDAVWHCGQVVALRRAAGNPIDPDVSVFRGIRSKK